MESHNLPSEYPSPTGKFKNIELLRFLMAWSIVGFHINHGNCLSAYGVAFLRDYTGLGFLAVLYFFVVAFFFLVLKTRPDCSVWEFVRNKWLRMAPLIIVCTLVGYVLHLYGFWGWNMSANIGQCLLIHHRFPASRWFQFVDPAWFCSVFFLCSILYLSWIKTLSAKYVALVVASIAFIGMEVRNFFPQILNEPLRVGFVYYGKAFTCLGISYVLATVFVITPPHQQLGKNLSSINCDSFVMDGRRNHLFEPFRSFALRRTFVQTLAALKRDLLCMPVLPLYSEGGLSVSSVGAGLVRLARALRVRHFHHSQTGPSGCKAHSFTGTQRMGACSSVVSSRWHGMRHHAFSNPWLPLHRSTGYALH